MAKCVDFACPLCRRPLTRETGHVSCRRCDAVWPIVDDVPHFIAEDQYWGEIDKDEMTQINQQIEHSPWRAVLLQHPSERVRRTAGMMMNLDRANWFLTLPVPRHATVLDIGAGTGAIAHSLALFYSQVIAVEPVLEHIQFMKQRFLQEKIDNVTLVRSHANMIPLPSQSVDLAILNGVLEWIPWSIVDGSPRELQLAALHAIQGVLRPGGFVCIGIENRWCIDFWLGANDPCANISYVTLLPRFLASRYSQWRLGTPYRNYLYSIYGYRRLLQDAGFSQVKFYCAIPSYNKPAFIIPFDDMVFAYYHKHFGTSYGHAVRRALVRLFRLIGLDKYTTNSFFIIAGKADAHS